MFLSFYMRSMSDFRNEHLIREKMTKFNIKVATNIDNQLSYQDVISIIFLLFSGERIEIARYLCQEVEKNEKNLVLWFNKKGLSLMNYLYECCKKRNLNKWSSSILEALFQVGLKKVLIFDLGVNMEKEERSSKTQETLTRGG